MVKPYNKGYSYTLNPSGTSLGLYQSKPIQSDLSQPYQTEPQWTVTFPDQIFSHGPVNYKMAALTFDDAPDSLFLPIMLDIFAHYDVKVTFFSLGRCAHQNPEMIERIVKAGHIIGNHTYNHVDITKIPINQLREEVQKTEEEIFRISGLRTGLFRPPFGFLNQDSIRIVLAMGYKIILWNIDSDDWMGLTGPAITARVLVNIIPGGIVLMHNACDGSTEAGTGTVQSLPFIIETLKAGGYTFTSIPVMLNIPAYK